MDIVLPTLAFQHHEPTAVAHFIPDKPQPPTYAFNQALQLSRITSKSIFLSKDRSATNFQTLVSSFSMNYSGLISAGSKPSHLFFQS